LHRIGVLTTDKETFKRYVAAFYESNAFSGPSIYFHNRVITLVRSKAIGQLLEDDHFLEYLYATLASWGMHRMGRGGAKMTDFPRFKCSILSCKKLISDLKPYKLDGLTENNKRHVFDLLRKVFASLRIMESQSNLVANSKILHHMLPDLVPPIDRQYTLRFFYATKLTSKTIPPVKKDDETSLFLEIMDYFCTICKKLRLTENDYDQTEPLNTSVPKVIDNAIIGFIKKRAIATSSSIIPTPSPSRKAELPRSKYHQLGEYLKGSKKTVETISYQQIEGIIGTSLPSSAYRHRAWWANSGHPQARIWVDAGWKVSSVNLGKSVTFAKNPSNR
jgi:hypothetical protein